MKKVLGFLTSLLFSVSAIALPYQPIVGGTGVSNSNSDTITLGGAINTAGAFTLSGAYSTTIQVTASTIVTLPTGTHTLASNDGSNASGTWGISITGSAAGGAPPTGAAGGSFLNGTYPNPGMVNNSVTNTQLAQMAADTFKGNNTGSTANAIDLTVAQAKTLLNLSGTNSGDVTLSGQNYLSLTGQALTANAVNLNSSNVTSTLPVASGGNGTNIQQNQGILWNNGTINTSNANLVFDGSSLLNFQTDTGASNNLEFLLNDNVSGISNSASVVIRRGDQANGQAFTQYFTYGSPSLSWETGFLANDGNYYLQSFNGTALTVSQTGVFNIPELTASELMATDSSKNLISGNLTGDVTSSQFATTLATVNSNTGSWGSATQVPQFTVNGKGLVTAVSNVTISGTSPGGSAGGDLTGTYPNPTVASNAITYAKFQQVAANSVVGNPTGSTANAQEIAFSATGGTSNIVSRDSNGNSRSNNTGSVATLVTSAAGTTTLTAASSKYQVLQGSTTQTYTLPDATTLFVGNTYEFKNESTGTLTVNNNGGSLIATIPGGGSAVILCTAISTTNGSWDVASSLPYATANTATTLVERDSSGNFSAGTITASLNGNATTASGAPPTGAAGGSFLNGSYPNPGMVSNSIGNSQLRQSAGLSVIGNSTSSTANVADITASSSGQVLTYNGSNVAFGSVNLASSNSVGSSVLPIGNGGNNTASQTTNGVAYYDGSKITTSANFYFSPTALTLSNAGSVSAPTLATELNLSSSTQDSARLVLSGQEFYQASNTSTDGLALVLGANRTGNRQLWFVDTANSAVNSTNAVLRIILNPAALGTYIDSVATNGNTFLPISYGNTSATTTINGSSIFLTGGDVTDTTGNIIVNTVNKGLTVKSAAVSGGTANASVVTGVVLSSGTATVNDSYVNTSTVCYASLVTSGGTPGTAWGITVASGSFTVKSTNVLDASTLNVACIKGN